ncbi:MAG: hypothetical protein A3F78_17820 [Burkholderiales bacterium RIFCSPLOWO2_12_FULL_61_40]|nr:MAG: hypothetical protein A3F78_17820 [Burkholderiales bacterium RIFCSPLOWO2_12_FULL_61_40]
MKTSHHLLLGFCVAGASLLTVAGAQAQSNTSKASSGYMDFPSGDSYVGLGAGRSDFSVGNGIGAFNRDQGDTAYNLSTGHYTHQNFGVELGYTDFGRIARAGGTTKAQGLNLSLIGRAPLGTSFNLLAKLGTTYGQTDVSSAAGSGIVSGTENGFGWSYGVGAEYLFNPKWSAVVQYDEHQLKFAGDNRDKVGVAYVGVRYLF